jgi:hypothetical protein
MVCNLKCRAQGESRELAPKEIDVSACSRRSASLLSGGGDAGFSAELAGVILWSFTATNGYTYCSPNRDASSDIHAACHCTIQRQNILFRLAQFFTSILGCSFIHNSTHHARSLRSAHPDTNCYTHSCSNRYTNLSSNANAHVYSLGST